jgi:hypothetical protein
VLSASAGTRAVALQHQTTPHIHCWHHIAACICSSPRVSWHARAVALQHAWTAQIYEVLVLISAAGQTSAGTSTRNRLATIHRHRRTHHCHYDAVHYTGAAPLNWE